MPPFGQPPPAHLLVHLPPPPAVMEAARNTTQPGMRHHSGTAAPPTPGGMRHPSGNNPPPPLRHPSANQPPVAGMRHPSGQNQHHAGRPRNISSSSSVGGHAGVDLAALAAMMGAGTAQVGRAAPPVTAINLEDLGMFDGQSLARLLF